MIMLLCVTGGNPCKINARCPKVPTTCMAGEIVLSPGGRGELESELDVKVTERIITMKKEIC